MFTRGFGAGERIAMWRADGAEALAPPRVRVLLPGEGTSVRERANAAKYVPSIQQAARQRSGRVTTGPGRSGNAPRRRAGREPRAVVRLGEPTPMEAARLAYGIPAAEPTDADRISAERLGVFGIEAEIGDALIDLGCWRERISSMPAGPALIDELAERPDALAPAPLRDPDHALAIAATAREMKVGERVVNCFANAVLESITARSKALAWLQAEQHTDLAMLSRNYPGLYEMLPTEVAFALRTSEAEAGSMISLARAFASRLPGTLEALRQGLINHGHAMAIARATSTTTPEIAAQVEADLLPCLTAPGSSITAEQLRRRAVRRVIKLDPDGAADRHRKAAVDRRITRWIEEDGMAGMKIYAPAQDIAIIWETATTLADAAKTPGDGRNLGNRRVDALTDLCAAILYRQTRQATGEAGPQPTPPGGSAAGSDVANPGTPADGPGSHTASSGTPVDAPVPGTAPGPTCDFAAPNENAPDTPGSAGTKPVDVSMDTATTVSRAPDVPAAVPARPTRPAGTPRADLPIPRSSPVLDPCITCGRSGTASPPALPKNHGQRPHIQVVIPYTVLLGGNEPCELVGHGAITADQARLIAADGVLRRLVTDPLSGTLLDYGRTRYEPPESLKQFVITRDGTCQAPGCLQPALRGQIDHVDPFHPGQPSGGKTNHSDLKNYCQHHHRAKDGGGFTNTIGSDGSSHWVTPLGRHYSRPPNEVWHPDDHENRPGQQNGYDAVDLDDGFPADFDGGGDTKSNHEVKKTEAESRELRVEPPPF